MVGRCRTLPSVLVNSRFVTGVGRDGIHGTDECGGRECELNDAHEVVERDPTHVLIAAADDAAEAEAEGREHLCQAAAVFAEDETDAEIDDANVGVARGSSGGFPLLADFGQKAATVGRGFIEQFSAAVAVVADGRGADEDGRFGR